MEQTVIVDSMADEDRRISETIRLQQSRLFAFIRRRVPDPGDAEDILQDVFYELVAAYRLMKPIEHAGAWLFRVARNRITDFLRKRRPEPLEAQQMDGEELTLADILPSPEGGPEAAYARTVLFEEIDNALSELPDEQRDVFIAHEIEGRSFRELAAESGLSMNTLLSRKRYAVLHLRHRLRAIHDELNQK
ncbi:MAG: RNA polymerase sigma factor [Bryobacteraceae bacterium]